MAAKKGNSLRRPKKDVATELNQLTRAVREQSRNQGKWAFITAQILAEGLAAIALACSTPEDNSSDVSALTARLKIQVDALQNAAQEPDE